MRKLASIQRIYALEPIPDKDRIVVAHMRDNAWHVVVRKHEFEIGDQCVYIEIDSKLPHTEAFDFMQKYKYRVKTIKIAGVLSQGLCLPMNVLPSGVEYKDGDDVTKILGVIHVDDAPEESTLALKQKNTGLKQMLFKWKLTRGLAKKLFNKKTTTRFPDFIQKTDETRIQVMPEALTDKTHIYEATEKIDGTSATYYLKRNRHHMLFNRYEFGVCSRNQRLLVDNGSPWWKIANDNNIKDKLYMVLKELCPMKDFICIQGEIIGPGIQGNKYHKKNYEFYMFNLVTGNIDKNVVYNRRRASSELMRQTAYVMALSPVPKVDTFHLPDTVEEMLEMADGTSLVDDQKPATIREGIVVRSVDDSSCSFKVVSNKFLLKEDNGDA